ncbi:type VI secretion system baseplate subunit TssF [Azohydromonas lata]|uniref:Type VI secretion system baseplate subunit TssF n=1 Tax=Azohydromonas lata TaxID=45677 RepID=A0ABU5IDE8_9BURK|nr:type VI secretion system baseplate subunit TssF [Azohydromonas lata]MDZ5456576.1 type VI secretion system baseplate subunit TssF [Azohydromonas lata]
MHELLPHYERELALLQQQAEEFAQRHPHIAGRLSASGELLQDPQVQHLLQSFALLAARVHARLDDDVPEITHPLLERLAPQWLRPLPGCAIARLDNDVAGRETSIAQRLPAGTALHSLSAEPGGVCRFTTTAEAQVLPVRVASAAFTTTPNMPPGSPVPRHASALLSLQLELTSAAGCWGTLGVSTLRLHLGGEPRRAAVLREALTRRVSATLVQVQPHGPWQLDACAQPVAVGLADAESLLGARPGWPAAQRLLAEWFCFPEKFNFLDFPLPVAAWRSEQRTLWLHFALTDLHEDGEALRRLREVSAADFLTNCVPVVNAFEAAAEAHPLPGHPSRFALSPAAQPPALEVLAVTGVRLQARSAATREGAAAADGTAASSAAGSDGEGWPLEPWCSLGHGLEPAWTQEARRLPSAWPTPEGGLYWVVRREPATPANPAGLVVEVVDEAGAAVDLPAAVLKLSLHAGNGGHAGRLVAGQARSELACAGGGHWDAIRLLREPTPVRRAALGGGMAWRLLSLLTPRPLSPYATGLEALKDALRLLDLACSPRTAELLEGLTALDSQPAQACMADAFGPRMLRGTALRLTVREEHFTGCGLHLFAQLLSRWFAQSARRDSFIRLHLISADTGELLFSGPPHSGEMPLI